MAQSSNAPLSLIVDLNEGTRHTSGQAFFDALTRSLAESLGAAGAVLAICPNFPSEYLQTASIWLDGVHIPNTVRPLNGSACQHVIEYGSWEVERSFQDIYSSDAFFTALGIEAYIGHRINDRSGNFLGVLAIVSREPMIWSSHIQPILAIMSDRCSVELEREKLLSDLQEREDTYQRAISAAGGVVYKFFLNANTYHMVGPGLEGLLGISRSEFEPNSWDKHTLTYVPRGLMAGLTRAETLEKYRSGLIPIWTYDHQWKTPEGVIKWISDTAVAIRDEKGSFLGSMGILQDITERKINEEALKLSKERLSVAVEASSDGLYDINFADHTSYFSPQAYRLLNYTGHEEEMQAIVFDYAGRIHPEDLEIMTSNYDRAMTSEDGYYRSVHRIRTRDGNYRWFNSRGRVMRNASGVQERLVGILTDISELRASQEYRNHQNRLESLGRLAGGIAHEFNNLLTAIIGGIELARIEDSNPAARREHLSTVMYACNRASAITGQLLSIARKQVAKAEVVNLNETLDNCHKLLSRLLPRNTDLISNLDHESWAVEIDPALFEQIAINLIVNAVDAMPGGGQIELDLVNVTLTETSGNLSTLPSGDYVVFSVSDQGDGIPEDLLDSIFEPFFTTKEIGKGTGLGLATSLGIVEQAGGTICCGSNEHGGTTFQVYIPRCTEASSKASPVRIAVSQSLVVLGNEKMVPDMIARMLSDSAWEIVSTSTLEETLEFLTGNLTACKAVIVGSGIESVVFEIVRSRITNLYPDIRVVLMTAGAGSIDQTSRREMASQDYLTKPFTKKELLRVITRPAWSVN